MKIYNNRVENYFKNFSSKNINDNLLFVGPSGLGKTTYSKLLCESNKINLKYINAISFTSKQDIYNILLTLNENECLFIDEIHVLPKKFYEIFYNVMIDNTVNIIYTYEATSKIINMKIPNFLFICATTEEYILKNAFLNRFNYIFRLNYLNDEQMKEFIISTSNMKLTNVQIQQIIEISHGILRKCVFHVNQVQDIGKEEDVYKWLNLNPYGLDDTMIIYLDILHKYKICSLKKISSCLGIKVNAIEETIEPLLIRLNLINVTTRGRELTEDGCEFYGKKCKKNNGNIS